VSGLSLGWDGLGWIDSGNLEVIILTIGQRWIGVDLLLASDQDLTNNCSMSQLVHQYPLES